MYLRKSLWCIVVLLTTIAILPSQANPPTATHIPVVINIHKDAGISKEDARKAVTEASKILRQAGMRLVVVKVNENATEGDIGNDGVIDWERSEYNDLTKAGEKEIEKLANKKGIKISFVKEPQKGVENPGWAFHRRPVVCVKNRGDAARTGSTIAHEIGHIMTLAANHRIDKDTTADATGHAPNKAGNSGRGNLMAPSNYRTGTFLTPDQITEMLTRRFVHGKCATQFEQAFPALKEQLQYGLKVGDTGDIGNRPAYLDLSNTTLWSLANQPLLSGQIDLGGLFTDVVSAQYALAFNSDNNALTGSTYGGFAGVDYAVEIGVSGSSGSYAASGVARRLSDNMTWSLSGLQLANSTLRSDMDVPSLSVINQILFDVDKSLLGLDLLSEALIPVGVLSFDSSLVIDSYSMEFDTLRWWRDPTLQTYGTGIPTAGAPYAFSVYGLTPDDAFSLYLNEELVFEGILDATGSFTGSFVFPENLSLYTLHFLTAQDSTGEFAYSFTCPVPEPSGLILGALALLGLIAAGRPRRKPQT